MPRGATVQSERMSQPAIADDFLDRGVVRLRRLLEAEAPFAGWLARIDGEVVQLVDTSLLRGWTGWQERGEHVLAMRDVVRTRTGHEAILPWCVERLEVFLGRRAGSGASLSPGERVTIAVSLLRGYRAGAGEALIGGWWITQDGTPTFVAGRRGEPGEPLGRATAVLLEKLDEGTEVTRRWDVAGIAALVRADEHTGEAETRIFASAEAQPLILAPLTPRRVAGARLTDPIMAVAGASPEHPARESRLARLTRTYVDADVATMVSDALEAGRQGMRRARRRLGRPWVVATGLAALIVTAGVAWPTDTETANAGPASSRPGTAEPMPTPSSRSGAASAPEADTEIEAEPSAPDAAVRGDEPVAALAALLARRAQCADGDCASEIFEDPGAFTEVPPGAADLAEGDREVTLLDDLGGVAVLSVGDRDAAEPPQYVILVRTPDGWLIRAIRNVETP